MLFDYENIVSFCEREDDIPGNTTGYVPFLLLGRNKPAADSLKKVARRNGRGAHFEQNSERGQGVAVNPRQLRGLKDLDFYSKGQPPDMSHREGCCLA